MIVVDTNVVASFLLSTPRTAAASALHERDPEWAAPPLWRSELRSVLVQQVRADRIDAESAGDGIALAVDLIVIEQDVESSLVLDLAIFSGCSAYDCDYVALAQTLDVRLATFDRRVLSRFPDLAFDPAAG